MKLMNSFDFIKNERLRGRLKGFGMKLSATKPELLLFVGGVSMFGATLWCCMKGDQGKKVVEKCKTDLQTITKSYAHITNPDGSEPSPEIMKEYKVEQGRRYVQACAHTSYELLKIYGLPALLWFSGMGLIVGSHQELRKLNTNLVTQAVSMQNLMKEYRERVAKAVGEETEKKIFMGVQEGSVNVLEKDPETGEEKVVKKKTDVFYAQPGSIFARNFSEETSDAFDVRSFADYYLDTRIDKINKDLELGIARAYTGMDVLRMLGYNENALGEDENIDALIRNGISGSARKVPDPEMRKLKVTRLRGYQKKWDIERNMEVYVPCLRLDFNFYPLEGKI